MPHKGIYCILVAIFCATASGIAAKSRVGIVEESVRCFSTNKAGGSDCDDHNNFNEVNFAVWFREMLLPSLVLPSLIIIDSESYSLNKPYGTPNTGKMRKADIIESITEIGVQHNIEMSVFKLRQFLKELINENVENEFAQLEEASGHKVLYTPPNYSDLKPI